MFIYTIKHDIFGSLVAESPEGAGRIIASNPRDYAGLGYSVGLPAELIDGKTGRKVIACDRETALAFIAKFIGRKRGGDSNSLFEEKRPCRDNANRPQ